MKKTIALLLALLMCLTLCACGNGEEPPETTAEATTETTEASVSTEPEPTVPVSAWKTQPFVDEFGDVIEDSAPTLLFTTIGTFKNTATVDSDLGVSVFVAPYSDGNHYAIVFRLWEYQDHPATYLDSDAENIILKIKYGDTIEEFKLIGNAPNDDPVLSYEEDGVNIEYTGDDFFNLLYEGTDLRCIIYIGNSQYNFTIESDNFADLCNEEGFTLPRMATASRYLGNWEYASGDATALSRTLEDTSKHGEVKKLLITIENQRVNVKGVDYEVEKSLAIQQETGNYDVASSLSLNTTTGYAVDFDIEITDQDTLLVTAKYYQGEPDTSSMKLMSDVNTYGTICVCEYTRVP